MFDFLRNLTKSAEEKRQEALNAYLDDALTPRQRRQFEQELSQDAEMQSELDDLRFFKQQLRQLPQRRVPRNFTLDPAVYAPPAKQPLFQFYPVLQGATVLTAFFFVVVLALGMFSNQTANDATIAFAPSVAESDNAAQGSDASAEVVEDTAVEEAMEEEEAMDEEEMMEEEEEEAAEEEILELAVEATAVFQVESEVMSETTSDEPMEEAAAEESEEAMEDTATGELSSDEGALSEEEAATSESEEPPLPATGGAANQVVTATPESTEGEEPALPATGGAAYQVATATPESTIFPSATATVSVLPRVATATAVPDRILPTDAPSAMATAVPPSDNDGSSTSANFNMYQQDDGQRAELSELPPQPPPPPDNTLRTIQIALGILLLAFGLTTFLVRRKM